MSEPQSARRPRPDARRGEAVVGSPLGDGADARLLHTGSRFELWLTHDHALSRDVAVKTPLADGPAWVHDVSRQEAVVLSRLRGHPAIVQLLREDTLADGRPALVLEHHPGSFAMPAGAALSARRTVALGITLAAALDAVHAAGVVHCDVRPANVLRSAHHLPVLAGFDAATVTASGDAAPPTPVTTAHMAPELLEGDVPTPRTDVYGLGATLYDLVSGRPAFAAYAGESAAAVILRVLGGQVRPIVAPDVPLELSDLLVWAMSPDPAARPPSPAWLAEELGRIEQREGWPRTHTASG